MTLVLSEPFGVARLTRKFHDHRYHIALEAAYDILVGDFGVPLDKVTTDYRIRKQPPMPDVYDALPPGTAETLYGHRVGVVIGILREETLLYFLDRFEWIVHLPLPETFGVYKSPTHYRVFKRTRAIEHGGSVREVWGDSLVHGRSQLSVETRAKMDMRRLADAEKI